MFRFLIWLLDEFTKKFFGLYNIDNSLGVNTQNGSNNLMGLIRGNNRCNHRDWLMAVTTITIGTGNTMLTLSNQGLYYRITLLCHNL